MLLAIIPREFKNTSSGISTPSIALVHLDCLEIHITLSNANINVRILGQGLFVLPSLVYPYFELDIKHDEIRKPWLIKQETN